jgi:hypothetical protein
LATTATMLRMVPGNARERCSPSKTLAEMNDEEHRHA